MSIINACRPQARVAELFDPKMRRSQAWPVQIVSVLEMLLCIGFPRATVKCGPPRSIFSGFRVQGLGLTSHSCSWPRELCPAETMCV